MEVIMRGILGDFINGKLSHKDLVVKFNQMEPSIRAISQADNLSKEGSKLFKLFQLAKDNDQIRLDKAFINKI